MNTDLLKIGLAQIYPVWLNKQDTIEKVVDYVEDAASKNCEIVCFSEALIPGYPFWIEHTNGAEFNSELQKEMFSIYSREAVVIENGDLNSICKVAKNYNIAVIVGIIEKPIDRGGHSLYCSRVFIDNKGQITSVHRKLMPTYEERMFWSIGDGHGLQVHKLKKFTIGALNCWENWMPLARTALTAMGEDLHFAIWPGNYRNTFEITRFMAMESRSFVVSVSGLMNKDHVYQDLPVAKILNENAPFVFANGGSCVASPDGKWLLEPVKETEGVFPVELNHSEVRKERHNFDPVGHYARPDVLKLSINRKRQSSIKIEE